VPRTEDLTPHMRRITLTGAALEPLAENGLHVSLFFPGAGRLRKR
jgi:NADPH-dependent ferric siderophore reductase